MNHFDRLKNAIQRESSKADNTLAQTRFGLIDDYNPEDNQVKVVVLPDTDSDGEKIIANWSHVLSHWTGDGYGDVAPTEPDNQIIIQPTYGSLTEHVVLGGSFNEKIKLAKGPNDIGGDDVLTKVGERLLRSKSGTTVKFVSDNTLMIKADNEKHEVLHIITKGTDIHITCSDHLTADVTSQTTINCPNITLNGNVLVTENLHVQGNVKGDQDVTDRLASMEYTRVIYDIHIHSDSPPPIPQMVK